MKRAATPAPFKFIFNITIVLLAIFLVIGYFILILKNSDYFAIKEIIVKGADAIDNSTAFAIAPERSRRVDISYLKGRNIFTVDLRKEQERVSQLYPVYKKIRLIRILPDRIFVDLIRRKPAAIIKLYRYYCVDEDAALFDIPDDLKELDLPIILGLDTKILGPKIGGKYVIRELMLALDIIKEIKKNNVLKKYSIKTIDVSSCVNASFFMPEGLEIKLGENNIRHKLDILSSLLIQIKSSWGNVTYIDLRFKEPVIKLKDVK